MDASAVTTAEERDDRAAPGPGTTLAEIRAAQRDPQAAATIYATWFEPVYRYCVHRLESAEAAEDATSRIFERVLKALPRYTVDEDRPGATFRSWLFAIAHNTLVDHHRRRRFHLSLDRLLHPFGDRPSIELPDPERLPDDQALAGDTNREGSNWILFQTQAGVTLVDATSGEIASQMKLPGARGGFPAAEETPPWCTDAGGDTVIIRMERQGRSSSGVPGAVWLLSPEVPNGLEITGPSDDHPIVDAFLSPDGTTLYASTSESISGPDDRWATPLGEEPVWELIAEDVSETAFLPLAQEE